MNWRSVDECPVGGRSIVVRLKLHLGRFCVDSTRGLILEKRTREIDLEYDHIGKVLVHHELYKPSRYLSEEEGQGIQEPNVFSCGKDRGMALSMHTDMGLSTVLPLGDHAWELLGWAYMEGDDE